MADNHEDRINGGYSHFDPHGKIDPEEIARLRKAIPQMIADELVSVQPMTDVPPEALEAT